MSSKTSVRRTTDPGVSARFSPTANRLVSTVDGRCGKSPAKRRAPRTRFRPPWSTVSLTTAGFDHGKLLGASASSTLPAAKRAWRSRCQSRPASEIRPSTASPSGEVALQHAAEQPARLPGRVGEAAVAAARAAAPSFRGRPASARRPRPAARRAARSGRRARPAATLTAAPGLTNRVRPGVVASVSITSSAARAASVVPCAACGPLLVVICSSPALSVSSGVTGASLVHRAARVIPGRTPTFAARCCEPTTTRGSSRLVEERADHGRRVLGLVEEEEVPAAGDDVEPGVGEAARRGGGRCGPGPPGRPRPTRPASGGAPGAARAGSTSRRPRRAGTRSRSGTGGCRSRSAAWRSSAPGSRAVRPPAMWATLSSSRRGW